MAVELNKAHWTIEKFVQRMTNADWRKLLLEYKDKITVKGYARRLTAKDLGVGVVEISKAPLTVRKPDQCET